MSISTVELLLTTLKDEANTRFAIEKDRDRFIITTLRQLLIDISLSPNQIKIVTAEIDRSNDRVDDYYNGIRRSIMNQDGQV
jgi:hypothetical protein